MQARWLGLVRQYRAHVRDWMGLRRGGALRCSVILIRGGGTELNNSNPDINQALTLYRNRIDYIYRRLSR